MNELQEFMLKAQLEGAKAEIQRLRSRGRWISVKDRLPETMDDVLCWYEYFRFGEYQRMFQKCGVGFCVHGAWGGEVTNGYKARVLYWMPLPEPPKEGADHE